MTTRSAFRLGALLLLCTLATPSRAQERTASRATRSVYLDNQGVVRWRDDRSEVALFGANYILPSASDYRAAGYLGADRKKVIDDDMAHFARMGWDGLRLTLWGDWENSDHAGNLIVNDHLDLFDYLIARARERGIYMLLSPIQTYNANWPDALRDTSPPGFSNHFSKGDLGTNPAAIAAQVNYLEQLLNHVNPYTGVALKNEPAILFIELINEPWHHPEDHAGSVRYINALVDAVRATGCDKILFHNISQDFRIANAIRDSKVQGVTFGWYPSALNSGHELSGNYLRAADSYVPLQSASLGPRARIVYEFDSADLRTGYMYPAMARAFRGVGAQFASMFAYDMLATASRNLGWQTHYLNLVYTPRKTMSAVIAAEVMRRVPRFSSFGQYPANTEFADFRVSYDENLGELAANDAFLYTAATDRRPPHPEQLRRIAGVGSSPVVQYDGSGVYFLDRVRDGVWRLEVYPDAVPVRDPFEAPNKDVIVTRALWRSWPMRIVLPDLGPSYTLRPVHDDDTEQRASDGRVLVRPGVYVVSAASSLDMRSLPPRLGSLAFDEFHPPPRDTVPLQVINQSAESQSSAQRIEIRARVVDTVAPIAVSVAVRAVGGSFARWFPMRPASGYDYRASISPDSLAEGRYEYAIVVTRGTGNGERNGAPTNSPSPVPRPSSEALTFPGGVAGWPNDWDFRGTHFWPLSVVSPRTSVMLFQPLADAPRLAFTRIGDAGRRGLFRTLTSPVTGAPVFHLELPVFNGRGLPDYTASLVLNDRLVGRRADLVNARALHLRLRGLGARQQLHLTLVEHDGTSWSTAIAVDSTWQDCAIPLTGLRAERSVLLPQGFPGDWNYWSGPAEGRGGPNDRPRLAELERLQLSLRDEPGVTLRQGSYGVEVESVILTFE